jgi:hypothetical protein
LLGIDGGTIGNIAVIRGESLLGFIDTYTVEFSINNMKNKTSTTGNASNIIPQPYIANLTIPVINKNQIPLKQKALSQKNITQKVLHHFTFQILRENIGKGDESNNS